MIMVADYKMKNSASLVLQLQNRGKVFSSTGLTYHQIRRFKMNSTTKIFNKAPREAKTPINVEHRLFSRSSRQFL